MEANISYFGVCLIKFPATFDAQEQGCVWKALPYTGYIGMRRYEGFVGFLKPFRLGYSIELKEFWSTMGIVDGDTEQGFERM